MLDSCGTLVGMPSSAQLKQVSWRTVGAGYSRDMGLLALRLDRLSGRVVGDIAVDCIAAGHTAPDYTAVGRSIGCYRRFGEVNFAVVAVAVRHSSASPSQRLQLRPVSSSHSPNSASQAVRPRCTFAPPYFLDYSERRKWPSLYTLQVLR